MAATLEELEDLERAIRSGLLKVRDRTGREQTYRSLEEMRSARDEMKVELGIATIGGSGRRRRVWVHHRGT